jgi:hypothetical protein
MVVDVDGVGLEPQPTRGPNPLDYMAASPWDNGVGFNLLEWNVSAWAPFTKLTGVSCDESGYSSAWCVGGPWVLSKRFTYRQHWREMQLHFSTSAEIEAQAVGK